MSGASPTEEPIKTQEEPEDKITLYVNNLPFGDCTQEEVQKLFEKYGEVINVTHRNNKKNGRFTGNSFVTFAKKEDGEKAIQQLNGYEYKGRKLRVEQAKRAYQKDYKSNPDDRRSYHNDRDRSPRYSRYRDDRYDREYPPRYPDRYYDSQVNYRGSRGDYYAPDPYYYDDNYRRGSSYRDYPSYEPSPSRYRRDEYYDSRQSQRSPRYYTRYSKSDEYE